VRQKHLIVQIRHCRFAPEHQRVPLPWQHQRVDEPQVQRAGWRQLGLRALQAVQLDQQAAGGALCRTGRPADGRHPAAHVEVARVHRGREADHGLAAQGAGAIGAGPAQAGG